MSMSKKDFIALADAIKEHNQWFGEYTHPFDEDQLKTLGDFCKRQNGRFNRERWLGYIKGENGPNGGALKPRKGECQATADAAVAVRRGLGYLKIGTKS